MNKFKLKDVIHAQFGALSEQKNKEINECFRLYHRCAQAKIENEN